MLVEAVKKQVEICTSYGAPTGLESDVAKLIKRALPSIEKLEWLILGSEATMSAIRLARGFTWQE